MARARLGKGRYGQMRWRISLRGVGNPGSLFRPTPTFLLICLRVHRPPTSSLPRNLPFVVAERSFSNLTPSRNVHCQIQTKNKQLPELFSSIIIKAPRFNFPRWSSLFLAVSTGSIDSDCLPEVAAILTAKLFIPEYPLVPPPA